VTPAAGAGSDRGPRAPGPIYLRVLCFIRDGSRVLLTLRNKAPNRGLYNAPGGKIEPDEDPFDACLREVAEETGIRLPTARLRAVLTIITRTTGAHWVLFVFTAERPPGEPGPIADDEGELRWVPLAEVAALPVVSDVPLILPHLFGPDPGVLMGKIRCDTDDADSMLEYEFRTG